MEGQTFEQKRIENRHTRKVQGAACNHFRVEFIVFEQYELRNLCARARRRRDGDERERWPRCFVETYVIPDFPAVRRHDAYCPRGTNGAASADHNNAIT